MKFIAVLFPVLLSFTAGAQDRVIKCDATDSSDRDYSFEFNVDSRVIQKKASGGNWKILYSDAKKCGLEIGKAGCSQTIQHNFNIPGQAHFVVKFDSRCISDGGTIHKEMNGVAEINQFGDGYGKFVCGSLSSNELQLSNCTVL